MHYAKIMITDYNCTTCTERALSGEFVYINQGIYLDNSMSFDFHDLQKALVSQKLFVHGIDMGNISYFSSA